MMIYTFEYTNGEVRESIIQSNKDKYLIEERNIMTGNFLVFSDVKPLEIELSEVKDDVNDVAELTTIVAMDKDEIAEMLVYALQRIDELEARING